MHESICPVMASKSTASTSSGSTHVIDLETDQFVIDLENEEKEKEKLKVEQEMRKRIVEQKKEQFYSQIGTIIAHRFEPDRSNPTKWNYHFLAKYAISESLEMPAESFAEHISECRRRKRGSNMDWMAILSNFSHFQMCTTAKPTTTTSQPNASNQPTTAYPPTTTTLTKVEDIVDYEVCCVKSLPNMQTKKVTVEWAPVWISAVEAVKYIPGLVTDYIRAVEPSMGRFIDGQLTAPFETEFGVRESDNLELLVASVDSESVRLFAREDNYPIGLPPLIVASKWGLELSDSSTNNMSD